MLLKFCGESAETFLYACREPGCFVRYDSSQGYFIDKQDAGTIEQEIRPRVSCPNDCHLMYLAEVRSERNSFRLWKCPECNTIRTNGEASDAAASSG
jgi:ribosomal protein L37AE/L43A